MSDFENYTLVIYETSKDYHGAEPSHRFLSYLKEIPEATLHEYGETQQQAISNLREQFDSLAAECEQKGIVLPPPDRRDEESFSGRMVLRMPSWLHRMVDRLADDEGISTNSYIVNKLIRATTIEETLRQVSKRHEKMLKDLTYKIQLASRTRFDSRIATNPTNLRKEGAWPEYKPLKKVI